MGFLKSLLGLGGDDATAKNDDNKSKEFDVLKYDGVRALRMGQNDYAVKCFEHALQIHDDLETCDYLSQAYLRLGDLESSYLYLGRLAEAQPENEQIWLRMANVAYMREDYDAQQQMSNKALEVNPESAEAHYLLAQSYVGQGNPILAIAMLTKAIAINEAFLSANLLRGETLLKMGDLAGAEADVKLLMEKVPENEDALLLAARVAKAKDDLDGALAYYDRVIDANPFSAAAMKERGAVKYAKGDKEGAEADARAAMELEPEQVADVNGDYTARGTEDIQRKVEEAYRNSNPFGV